MSAVTTKNVQRLSNGLEFSFTELLFCSKVFVMHKVFLLTLTIAKPKGQGSHEISHEEENASQLKEKEKESCANCPSVGCCCQCCPCQDTRTSSLAIKAAQEATQAQQAQQIAGAQASQQVKFQLAQRAEQAARAAEAALSGKQALVNQLEHEVREAQCVVQEEAASCQRTHANLQISCMATIQARCLLKTLTNALQISQTNLANSHRATEGIKQELIEKIALLEAAKCRAEALTRELCIARQDLCAIKVAAYRAQCAARNACCNAQRGKRLQSNNFEGNNRLSGILKKVKGKVKAK